MEETLAVAYTKSCTKCGIEQTYCDRYVLRAAIKKNLACRECSRPNKTIKVLELNCPKCHVKREFSKRESYNYAVKHKTICKKCDKRRTMWGSGRINVINMLERFNVK